MSEYKRAVKKYNPKNWGKSLFGGKGSTGAFGTGQFKGQGYDIKEEPFTKKLEGEGTQEELRKKQAAQSERLEEQAKGERSIADAQLKAATDRSLSQQLAAAQSRRGGSAASRERALAKASSQATRDIAQQSSIAKLQERQAAEQQLAQQLQSQRAQDSAIAESQRSSEQSLEELKMKQQLALQGVDLAGFQSAAQARSNFMGNIGQAFAMSDGTKKMNVKAESGESSAGADFAKNFGSASEDDKKVDDSAGKALHQQMLAEISDKSKKKKTLAEKINWGGKYAKAKSDKDSKKNKSDSDMNPKSFLDALKAYSYEYKDPSAPGAGKGRHLSVMAQDLEKAGPVGKSMVQDTPEGKMVDYGKGFGAILAAQAHLNERLSNIEKSKKKKA